MSGALSGLSKKYTEDDSPPPVHKTQKQSLHDMEDSSTHSLVNKKMGAICRITFKQSYRDECDLWDNKQLMHPGTSLGVGSGTGFLVAPGYVMTNHHVIPHKSAAKYARVHFEETALELNSEEFVSSPVGDAIDKDNLDFTVVALRDPSSIQHLFDKCFDVFKRYHPKNESIVNIIHHPVLSNPFAETRADQKISKILIDSVSKYGVHYRLESSQMEPTAPGSSGGPLFTNHGTLVALHHASGEAIRMDKIAENLGEEWLNKIEASREFYQGAGTTQQLREHYSKHITYPQFCLDQKGTIRKHEQSFKKYTQPALIQGTEVIDDLNTLFAEESNSRILIFGEAGVGKRTFCEYVSYAWTNSELWSHFKGVFLVKIKNINPKRYPDVYEDYTFRHILHKECGVDLNLLNQPDFFTHSLLILDGYHALRKLGKNEPLKRLVEKELVSAFPNILITSRTPVPFEATAQFEMSGFCKEAQDAYIRDFFRDHPTHQAVELIEWLEKDSERRELAKIPFSLHLMCLSIKQHAQVDVAKVRAVTDLFKRTKNFKTAIQQWLKMPNLPERSTSTPRELIQKAIDNNQFHDACVRMEYLITQPKEETAAFPFVHDLLQRLLPHLLLEKKGLPTSTLLTEVFLPSLRYLMQAIRMAEQGLTQELPKIDQTASELLCQWARSQLEKAKPNTIPQLTAFLKALSFVRCTLCFSSGQLDKLNSFYIRSIETFKTLGQPDNLSSLIDEEFQAPYPPLFVAHLRSLSKTWIQDWKNRADTLAQNKPSLETVQEFQNEYTSALIEFFKTTCFDPAAKLCFGTPPAYELCLKEDPLLSSSLHWLISCKNESANQIKRWKNSCCLFLELFKGLFPFRIELSFNLFSLGQTERKQEAIQLLTRNLQKAETKQAERFTQLISTLALYFGIRASHSLGIVDALDAQLFPQQTKKLLKESLATLYLMKLEQREDPIFLARLEWLILKPLQASLQKAFKHPEFGEISLIDQAIELITAPRTEQEAKEIKPLVMHLVQFLLRDEAPLQTHQSIYSTLSKHLLLESLREAYIQALSGHEFVKSLASIPNRAGFRQSFRIDQASVLDSISALCLADGSTSNRVEIEIPGLGIKQLNPEIARELILMDTGEINPNSGAVKEYSHCRHTVRSLPNYGLHLKVKPDHPCMEYAVCSLMHRLFDHGPPPTQLARMTLFKEGRIVNTYPVLFSKTVTGQVFDPDHAEGLDPVQLTELLLSQILILPGDADARNFIRNGSQLFCIDNDVCFVEPVIQVKKGWRTVKKIQLTSILFCLKQLKQLDQQAVDRFCHLDPLTILSEWLNDLIEKEWAYTDLFPDIGERKVLLETDQERSFTPFFILAPGSIARLYEQFRALQTLLKEKHSLTPSDLLKALIGRSSQTNLETSKIGSYVNRAYQKTSGTSASVRLQQAVKHTIGQSMTSSQALIAQIGKIPTTDELNKREAYSPEKAREELFGLHLGYSSQHGEIIYSKDQATFFQKMKKENQPDVERQRLVLATLFHMLPESISALNLSYCEALDDSQLESILSKFRSLKALDLRYCPLITSKSLPKIAKLCPELEGLYLSGSAQLTEVRGGQTFGNSIPITFKKLKILHIAHCPKLAELNLIADDLIELKMNGKQTLAIRELRSAKLEKITCSALSDFNKLKALTALKEFKIENAFLTNEEWEGILQSNPNLTQLDLTLCPNVTALPALSQLEVLQARRVGFKKIEGSYPKLRQLHLNQCGYLKTITIEAPSLDQFQAHSCHNLNTLQIKADLSQLEVLQARRVGFKKIEGSYPKLKQLHLNQCGHLKTITIEAPSLDQFRAQSCNTINTLQIKAEKLTELNCANSERLAITPESLFAHPYLEHLDLSHNKTLSQSIVEEIPQRLSNLKSLVLNHSRNIQGNLVFKAPFKQLSQLDLEDTLLESLTLDAPKLTDLNLQNNPQLFLKGTYFAQLKTLNIRDCPLPELKQIQILPKTCIKTISLSSKETQFVADQSTIDLLGRVRIYLDCEGSAELHKVFHQFPSLYIGLKLRANVKDVKTVAAVLPSSQIIQLDLSHSSIGYEGAKTIASALPKSQITQLDLRGSGIGDEGAKAIASALPKSQITQLDLSYNSIWFLGAKAIASALPKSQVTQLDLRNSGIKDEGAKVIARALPHSQVTQLNLRSNSIEEEGAKAIASALPKSQVTQLDLSISGIKDEGAKAIATALPESQVTQLDLRSNSIGDEGAKNIASALPESQVTQLDLSYNRIGAEGAKALASALPKSQVTQLDLGWNSIGDEGAKAIASALPKSQVTQLDLSYNHIGAEGAKALASALPKSQVIQLDLAKNSIKDEGVKALASALPNFQVTQLDFSSNKIGDEGAKALASALPNSQFTQLDLENNSIEGEGAKALASALPESQVTQLDLSYNRIGAEGAKALASALPKSQVTQLDLSGNSIGDEGAKAIASALPHSQVTQLDLSGNSIGDEGAKAIASALPHSQVTQLNLSSSRIGDEGAKALASALPDSQVTQLNLGWNSIGDEGAKAIASTLPESQVTQLDLSHNSIGHEGAKAIASALPHSQVTQLYLSYNKIGNEGAKALASTLPKSQITQLDLSYNSIGAEGAKALASALPDSQVTQLNLGCNSIGDEGAKAIASTLPESQVTQLDLSHNSIEYKGAKALKDASSTGMTITLNRQRREEK